MPPARDSIAAAPDRPGSVRRPLTDRGEGGVLERSAVGFRAAMLIGAGLTLAVWLFAGLYFSRRLAAVQADTDAISQRYVRAQQLVTDTRSNVLLSSVYLREALLDRSGAFVADSRDRMSQALEVAEQSLDMYETVLDDATEVPRVSRLRAELTALRGEMVAVLAVDPSSWPDQAGALLRGRLMPRREAVVSVANELGILNRTAFVTHQRETAAIYRATQNRVWQIFGLAVLASLGIAYVAAQYGSRLERRVSAQRERDVAHQADLQRLSAALFRAREDERRAVARELHDEIGQLLTASKVELAVAQRAISQASGDDRFDEARRVVDQALQAVRDLSHLLHPAVLDDLGLAAAVDWHVRAFRKRYPITTTSAYRLPTARLPHDVELVAYRIVQEGLNNVVRHARATRCAVQVSLVDSMLVVEVGDDGRGFEVDTMDRSRGLGVISMRQRAAELGGTLTIESGRQGTRIVAQLPIAVADLGPAGDVA